MSSEAAEWKHYHKDNAKKRSIALERVRKGYNLNSRAKRRLNRSKISA